MLITSSIVSGLGLGSMYGLIALGFHVTYVVSNTVNFSQGSAMMLGAVLGYTFAVTLGWPLPLAAAMALLLCAFYGLVVERMLVRPFADRGSNAWLMATIAGGIVLDNAILFTFGKEPRSFPSVLAIKPVEIFGAGVYPLQLVIPVVGLGIALLLHFVLHWTRLGKTLLAVVQNPDAARLMGINVRVAIAASFMISTVLAGLAGLLIAPLFNVHSDMGTLFGIKAFAVAILGGITSASGVMLAGLAFGLIEALVTAYFGSVYTHIVTF
jgi:branched-chain amino acid transport system permease protein